MAHECDGDAQTDEQGSRKDAKTQRVHFIAHSSGSSDVTSRSLSSFLCVFAPLRDDFSHFFIECPPQHFVVSDSSKPRLLLSKFLDVAVGMGTAIFAGQFLQIIVGLQIRSLSELDREDPRSTVVPLLDFFEVAGVENRL